MMALSSIVPPPFKTSSRAIIPARPGIKGKDFHDAGNFPRRASTPKKNRLSRATSQPSANITKSTSCTMPGGQEYPQQGDGDETYQA